MSSKRKSGSSEPTLPGTAGTGKGVARARRGIDETIKTLTATGVIDRHADAALIALGRTLADQIDRENTSADPRPGQIGYLSGQLTPILDRLRAGRGGGLDGGDAFAEFLAAIHTPEIRDA